MVTWWKKIKYNKVTKALACVLLSIAVLFLFQSTLILQEASWSGTYYSNGNVQYELIRRAGYVRDWIVRYADEDIFDMDKMTQEEIDNYIQSSEVLSMRLEEAKQNNSEEEKKATEEQAKKKILESRKQYKGEIEEALADPNVIYLALNKNTKQVLTNLEAYNGENQEQLINMLKSKPLYIEGNGGEMTLYESNNSRGGQFQSYYKGEPFITQYDYEIYVALADTLVPGQVFYAQQQKYTSIAAAKKIAVPQAIISGLMLLLLIFYGVSVLGKTSESNTKIVMCKVDKVPFEIQGILVLILSFIWFELARQTSHITTSCREVYFDVATYGGSFLKLYILLSLALVIAIVPLASFIRHIKNKSMSQAWLCVRLGKSMGNAIKEDNLVSWIVGGGIIYIAVIGFCMFLMVIGVGEILGLILWLGIMGTLVGVLVVSVKLSMDYVKIARASKQIVNGDFNTKVNLTYTLPIMEEMAHNLNNIGQGLEVAVDQSLKSERLKTELITNVSHDLKTPLTSIISYIDLLKDEEIENKIAEEYIEVLSERSNRLKQLVEDLVEASKAATGNIKSDLQVLKLNELVLQAVGEYSDRLAANHLEIVTKPLEEVSVLADGRHMWRIIENLLSNVSKYAMPYTRVYVEVRQEGEYGQLVIKNISKESLNLLEASELTERFVRGDDSRTTEGSGLGLAIAQSLTQVQNGKMSIHLDGDLFKVEIRMPLGKKF